jgi:parvulin-like peptidyl-prolyl isomerase
MSNQSSTPKVVTKKHIARLERERRQTRIILAVALIGILIVVGLLAYGSIRYNIVADVNGTKITAGEWEERVKLQRVQMINMYRQYEFYQQNFGFDYSQQMQQIQFSLQSPEVVGQQVLDQMVDEILIRQEAEKRGITASAEEVEASIRENFNFFPDGTPTPTITPTDISFPTLTSQQLTLYPPTTIPTQASTATPEPTATLDPLTATATTAPASPTPLPEPTGTPYTLEGYQTEYGDMLKNFEEYGISEQTVRNVYEAQILRRKLKEEVTQDATQVEEQVWARHILVETKVEAQAALDLINQGIPFTEVARKYSKDTGSGMNGGDLGWFGRGMMVPEFEKVAFDLEVGEVSEPAQSQFGYHIIQVLGHQEVPLNASQREQKQDTDFNNWLVESRGKADIKTFDVWKERIPTEPDMQTQAQPQP